MESIGMPFGQLSALLAGATEFGGGLLLLAGFRVAWVAVPVTFTMLVAAFTAHSGFDAQQGGFEYPLTLAVATAALGLSACNSIE
jgi:putative oxidoreductase